jgi:hypothetical protein
MGYDDDDKIYLREIDCEHVDWIHLAHDGHQWRVVVNTVMNLRDSMKGWEYLD